MISKSCVLILRPIGERAERIYSEIPEQYRKDPNEKKPMFPIDYDELSPEDQLRYDNSYGGRFLDHMPR